MNFIAQIKLGQVPARIIIALLCFVAVGLLVAGGCKNEILKGATPKHAIEKRIMVNDDFGMIYYDIVIDGCEYLVSYGSDKCISHKGNCKYCIERSKIGAL